MQIWAQNECARLGLGEQLAALQKERLRELEKRIRARGLDSEEAIARRLERARQEIQRFREYDFIVVNDDLERAGREIQAIATAARARSARNAVRIRAIVDSFGGT